MNNFVYSENNKQRVVSVGLQGKATNINELNKNYKPVYKDEVIIVKTITLNDKDFEQFTNNLLDDYNFIEDNKLYYKVETDLDYNMLDRVLLITSQDVDYGIIVDTQGYSYARYTAYYKKPKTPNQRLLELGWKLIHEDENMITYGKYSTETIGIFKKERKHFTMDINYIDLQLAEVLVDYLKELKNE